MARRAGIAGLAALGVWVIGSAAQAAEIGDVAAVNPRFDGSVGAAAPVIKSVGDDLFENERVTTSAEGSAQLLFNDQSTLSVAPNSDLTLDRYVYDPATETGAAALSLSRGLVRFIGGRISKTNDVEIRTETATIGVRGGIAVIGQLSSGGVGVVHIAGERTLIQAGGDRLALSREGAKAIVQTRDGRSRIF